MHDLGTVEHVRLSMSGGHGDWEDVYSRSLLENKSKVKGILLKGSNGNHPPHLHDHIFTPRSIGTFQSTDQLGAPRPVCRAIWVNACMNLMYDIPWEDKSKLHKVKWPMLMGNWLSDVEWSFDYRLIIDMSWVMHVARSECPTRGVSTLRFLGTKRVI